MENEILRVERLSVSFAQYGRGLKRRLVHAVEDLSLSVRAGEIVAVVGSSGSGKSLLAHAVMGILPYNSVQTGEIFFDGEPLDKKRAEKIRGNELVLVPQSVSYLDPLMKVGKQAAGSKKFRKQCLQIFSRYGLSPETADKYPFQLSGGMTRRVLISTAVLRTPKLVIADEPTPGLHLEAAVRVMGHFREMADMGAGVLLITHDLELALQSADRIVVFYGGRAIEEAKAADFKEPGRLSHPYARALAESMPGNWSWDGEKFCDTGDILAQMKKEYGR